MFCSNCQIFVRYTDGRTAHNTIIIVIIRQELRIDSPIRPRLIIS